MAPVWVRAAILLSTGLSSQIDCGGITDAFRAADAYILRKGQRGSGKMRYRSVCAIQHQST
jgi:hypothetical protein